MNEKETAKKWYNQKIACQKVTSAKRVFELLVDSYKILIKDDNNE